jgi:hypothetical protein
MNSSTLINAIACKPSTGTKKTRAFIAARAIAPTLSECAVFPYSSNPPADQQITADVDGPESVANEVHGVAKVVHSIAIDR